LSNLIKHVAEGNPGPQQGPAYFHRRINFEQQGQGGTSRILDSSLSTSNETSAIGNYTLIHDADDRRSPSTATDASNQLAAIGRTAGGAAADGTTLGQPATRVV